MNRRTSVISACAGIMLVLSLTSCGSPASSKPAPKPFRTSPPPRYIPGAMSVRILPSTGPRTITKKAPLITFYVTVKGLHLDAPNVHPNPQSKHGHIQVYLDQIPGDAFTKPDSKGVLAVSASPAFSLGLTPQWIQRHRGKHRFVVALAKNNNVLYHAHPKTVPVTVK